MGFDLGNAWDAIKDGTKEITEVVQNETSEFHEKYISKVLPDCGKYGDAAKFVAEMAPGVSEYNAIVEGDWTAFAIAAGIDIAAIAAGAVTAGAGYVAMKSGGTVAKAGAKVAMKEIAEAGAKKIVKETVEKGAKKAAKEVVEAGVEKVVKETVEAGAEKVVKETVEAGAEKVVKETVEAGAEKVMKETVEAGTEKAVKEIAEEGVEKAAKETVEASVEKTTKEVAEEGVEKISKESIDKAATKGIKEVGEKIDKKLIPDYLKEVEKLTNREIKPDQMEKLKKALDGQDFSKLDSEKAKLHRKLFDNARDKLIDEWEKNTGDKWPVYTQDILNDAGEVIRTAGQRYDAHHLIESSFGGPNAWWNLHPAAFPAEHQAGIHSAKSMAKLIF